MTNRQVLLCGGPRDGYWTTWNDNDQSRHIVVPVIPPLTSAAALLHGNEHVPSFESIVYTVRPVRLFGHDILVAICQELDGYEETDLIMRSVLQRDVYHVMTRGH